MFFPYVRRMLLLCFFSFGIYRGQSIFSACSITREVCGSTGELSFWVVFAVRAWPVWVTLLLALPTGAFLVRIFIFFHDCCHGSYLASRKAMHVVGAVLGFLVFTPFGQWRHSHGIHHSTAGNLDRRGFRDHRHQGVPARAIAGHVRRRHVRNMALLRAAPIRSDLLGAQVLAGTKRAGRT